MTYEAVKLGPAFFPSPSLSRALAGGYFYIGEPDTDPTVAGNQKTVSVLQENGTITPISQPVDLGQGGVPLYNSSYVTILVEGSYSLAAFDSEDTQVYYVPDSYDIIEQSTEYSDASFRVYNSTDNTKKLDFDLSNITTATKRTMVLPDANVDFTDQVLYSDLDTNGHMIQNSKGSDVASSATLNFGLTGNYFDVTGTTTISAFRSVDRAGVLVCLHFDDIVTLEHSSDLVMPYGADYTTYAGEELLFVSYAADQWRCVTIPARRNVVALGSISGAVDIDCSKGEVFSMTIGGNTTLTFINKKPSGQETSIQLITENAGDYTFSISGTINWDVGVTPTFTSSGRDRIVLSSIDGSTFDAAQVWRES